MTEDPKKPENDNVKVELPDDPEKLKELSQWPQGKPIPKPLKTDKLQIIVDEPQFPLNYQTRRNVQIVEYLCAMPDDKLRLEWLRRKVFKEETIERFMNGVRSELEYRKRMMQDNGHEK